jgi:hypothetical protein
MELRLEKTTGIFLHINGQWHVVQEINVDYDPRRERGKIEIRYQKGKGDEKYRSEVNAPNNLVNDLKAFGLSDVKGSVFLVKLESNRKVSWRIATKKEIERNPNFAQIYG